MAVKEEISLLPSSVKSLPRVREGKVFIMRSFHWLLIATLALMFGWLVLLSVRCWQPALSEEVFRSLMREQEVRKILVETNLTRTVLFFESQQSNETTQARDRRQSVSSQTATKLRTDDSALIQENIRKIDQLRTEITLLELRTSQSQVTPGSWIIRRFDKT